MIVSVRSFVSRAVIRLNFVLAICALSLLLAVSGCSTSAPISKSGRTRARGPQSSLGGLADSPWPRVGHDNGNTSLSGLLGPTRPALKSAWSHPSSPVIGADGTLYIGSKGGLRAVSTDGRQKWEYRAESHRVFMLTPSVGRSGMVYSASSKGKLVALRPDGTTRWEYEMGSWPADAPAIGADGTIYCASGQGRLFALQPNGRKRWVFVAWNRAEWRRAKLNLDAAAAAATDGTLYVTVRGPRLYAISPSGKQLWSLGPDAFPVWPAIAESTARVEKPWPAGRPGPDVHLGAPTAGPGGSVYVVASAFRGEEFPSRLYAISRSGRIRWALEGGWGALIRDNAAVGRNGTVYVADDWGYIRAVDPSDGRKKWRALVSYRFAEVTAGPTVDASGTIYAGCVGRGKYAKGGGVISAIDSSGKRKWIMGLKGCPGGDIVIGPKHTLYVSVSRWVGPGPEDYKDYLLAIGEK